MLVAVVFMVVLLITLRFADTFTQTAGQHHPGHGTPRRINSRLAFPAVAASHARHAPRYCAPIPASVKSPTTRTARG